MKIDQSLALITKCTIMASPFILAVTPRSNFATAVAFRPNKIVVTGGKGLFLDAFVHIAHCKRRLSSACRSAEGSLYDYGSRRLTGCIQSSSITSTSLYHSSAVEIDEDRDRNFRKTGHAAAVAAEATTDDNDNNEAWKNPRSRWARRKHRKRIEKLQQQQHSDGDVDGAVEGGGGSLDWESFEFGTRSVIVCFVRM